MERITKISKGASVVIAILLITGLALSACGSSSSSNTTTSTTTSSASTHRSQLRAYKACLKAHGVSTSKSNATASTVSSQTRSAARAACRSKLPSNYKGSNKKLRAKDSAYRACLISHGVQIAKGTGLKSPAILQEPAYAGAAQACSSLKPGASTSTTTSTPSLGTTSTT